MLYSLSKLKLRSQFSMENTLGSVGPFLMTDFVLKCTKPQKSQASLNPKHHQRKQTQFSWSLWSFYVYIEETFTLSLKREYKPRQCTLKENQIGKIWHIQVVSTAGNPSQHLLWSFEQCPSYSQTNWVSHQHTRPTREVMQDATFGYSLNYQRTTFSGRMRKMGTELRLPTTH